MNLLRNQFLFGLLLAGISLHCQSVVADEGSDFRILETVNIPKRTVELRNQLEGCVDSLGIASVVTVQHVSTGAYVKVDVTNRSKFVIFGLVAEVNDPDALKLGLGGSTTLTLPELLPGGSTTFSQFVPEYAGLIDGDIEFSIIVTDLLGNDDLRIIGSIFETRWPYISSAKDLEIAFSHFCDYSL